MADRSFVRDAFGRFAKSAGQAIAKEAKKAAKEAAADAKRVAKAKLEQKLAEVQGEIDASNRELKALGPHPGRSADVHETVEYEQSRKRIRDALRKATLKKAALRASARAVQ